jgi:predicted ATPase
MRDYLPVMRGELAAGEALSRQSFADLGRMGSSWNETYHLSLLAGCCARSGLIPEALELLDGAMAIAENTGERWFEAKLRRLIGECLTAESEQAAAARLQGAIVVAQEQDAKLWELCAATNLARLWGKQGKRTRARALLAPVYAWFTQGFDTPDLKDAKALLGKL